MKEAYFLVSDENNPSETQSRVAGESTVNQNILIKI